MLVVEKSFDINYIDPSSISTFNRCPAKYVMSRQMGLEKQNRSMIPLDYGSDMHEVLPYCYDLDTVDFAIDLFKQRWEPRDHEFNKARNIECATASIWEFARSHSGTMCPYEVLDLDIEAPTKINVSKNEVPFLVDIGGPLCLAGRIDLAVRWKSDNSLWTLDYKTSGEVSNRLCNCFENCPQAIAYTLALSQITGERARGMIVELIRVSPKNAESMMHMIFVKDHQVEEFIEFANRTAEQILECNEKKEWPTCCSNCSPYASFGMPGYICDYLSICDSPDKNDMFRFYNKNEPFHPFEISSGE